MTSHLWRHHRRKNGKIKQVWHLYFTSHKQVFLWNTLFKTWKYFNQSQLDVKCYNWVLNELKLSIEWKIMVFV